MARRHAVTIKDVAERAGVSLMTVSAVLNGKASERRISDSTRDRVSEVARQLDYRPNTIARSLRRKSTNVIGVYSGIGYLNATNPFLSELIGGLQEGCDQHKKDLLLHGTFRGRSVDDIYAELLGGSLDGLIVQAPPNDPLVAKLIASQLPVVAVADTIPSVPSVVVDDAGGMRMLIEHMAQRGHRRIIHIHPRVMIVSAARRRDALIECAAPLGIEILERFTSPEEDFRETVIKELFQAPVKERPTAVMAWSDVLAYEFIGYCSSQGYHIPEDVAVTGFDGFALPYGMPGRLTTVRASWSDVGRTAIGLLTAHLEGQAVPDETVLPVKLILGDTA